MSGYGKDEEEIAESVTRCIATGVAGLSIEDSTGDPSSPLYDLPTAAARVRAARQAIDQSGEDVLLTARAECYLVGHADPFRESIRRLQAYVAAGADVLFAPGIQSPTEPNTFGQDNRALKYVPALERCLANRTVAGARRRPASGWAPEFAAVSTRPQSHERRVKECRLAGHEEAATRVAAHLTDRTNPRGTAAREPVRRGSDWSQRSPGRRLFA